MIDAALQPLQQRFLQLPAQILTHLRIKADQITLFGFLLGLLVVPALAYQAYSLALLFLLLNRFADGLDGAVARLTEPTDRGAFLDISCDFFFYAISFRETVLKKYSLCILASFLISCFIDNEKLSLFFLFILSSLSSVPHKFPSVLTRIIPPVSFFLSITLCFSSHLLRSDQNKSLCLW